MERKSLLSMIADFMFGNKYYANIIQTRGTSRVDVCSYVFPTREEAMRHRKEISSTASFEFVETITFRSRNFYQLGNINGIPCSVWLG